MINNLEETPTLAGISYLIDARTSSFTGCIDKQIPNIDNRYLLINRYFSSDWVPVKIVYH